MSIRFSLSSNRFDRSTNLPPTPVATLMAWMRMSVDRNLNTGLLSFENGGIELLVVTDADGVTLGLLGPSTTAFSTTVMVVGQWAHIAMTISAAGAKLYFNGSLITSITDTLAALTIIHVADSLTTGSWFNGCVKGVKLWNRALVEQEIVEEMRQMSPVSTVSLNSWHLTPSPGAAGLDYSNSARNFLINTAFTGEDDPIAILKIKRFKGLLQKFPSTTTYPGYYGGGWQ